MHNFFVVTLYNAYLGIAAAAIIGVIAMMNIMKNCVLIKCVPAIPMIPAVRRFLFSAIKYLLYLIGYVFGFIQGIGF